MKARLRDARARFVKAPKAKPLTPQQVADLTARKPRHNFVGLCHSR
jgi:hypothetical protein